MANRVGNHVGACPAYRNNRTNDEGMVVVKHGVVHALEAHDLKLRDVVLLRILQCTAVTAHKQKTSKMVFLLFVVIVSLGDS
jgi:hypothetical protein